MAEERRAGSTCVAAWLSASHVSASSAQSAAERRSCQDLLLFVPPPPTQLFSMEVCATFTRAQAQRDGRARRPAPKHLARSSLTGPRPCGSRTPHCCLRMEPEG